MWSDLLVMMLRFGVPAFLAIRLSYEVLFASGWRRDSVSDDLARGTLAGVTFLITAWAAFLFMTIVVLIGAAVV